MRYCAVVALLRYRAVVVAALFSVAVFSILDYLFF
jgi:hypothetical protein